MVSLTHMSGKEVKELREFVCDTDQDIATLPTDCAPGSTAIVIENGSVYMMNSKGEWVSL